MFKFLKTATHQFSLFLLFSCFIFAFNVELSGQNFQWVRGAGNIGGLVIGKAITTDLEGNIYSTGIFEDSVDFDPGIHTVFQSSPGNQNVYVMKTDSIGKLIWVRSFGSSSDEEVNSIVVDHLGNVIVAGGFNGTVDFDPGPGQALRTSGSTTNIFQWKADANGNFLRVFTYYCASMYNTGMGLTIDKDKNLIMTGYFNGVTDFDPGPATFNLTPSGRDAFIQKLDSNDNFIWAKVIGGSSYQEGNACKSDDNGNIYLTGSFWGTTDFDPGPGTYSVGSPSQENGFLLKLNSAGNFKWVISFGSTPSSSTVGLAIDVAESGNVYFGGYFQDSADFAPGPATNILRSAGQDDMFIASFDSTGNHRWAHGFGNTSNDQFMGIGLDAAENVYAVGRFFGSVDFDPSLAGVANLVGASNTYSGVTEVLDSSGNYQWASQISNGIWTEIPSIAVLDDGSCISTGRFASTLDFDPGPAIWVVPRAANAIRSFIYKLGPCDASQSFTLVNACDSLIYNGHTYFGSDTQYPILQNYLGCDSFVEIEITMNYATFSSVTFDTCAPFILNGISFDSTGSYPIVLSNSKGCDSVVTANLTLRQDAYSSFADTACSSYLWNGLSYTSTGTYEQYFPRNNGCDSIATLQLTIGDSRTVHTINACEPVTFGGQLYSSSTYFEWNYTSIAGCDSVVVLDLNILPLDTGIALFGASLMASMPGGTYSWIDCGNNFAEIQGENSRYFTPSQAGSYAVILSNGACTDTSDCYVFTVLDLLNAESDAIRCFPNPSKGELSLIVPLFLDRFNVQLFDAYGKRILETDFQNSHETRLTLPETSGVYFLKVSTELFSKTFKVLRL